MLRRSLVLVAALAAVLAPSSAARPRAAAFPVTIHAANGDVVIESRPTRIVSLSPTGTEDLFAVGAGPQVIAVDSDSDYPRSAPHTTLSGYTPNVEAIAGYNPDLVVVSNDIDGIVESLQKLGVTVLLEPAANTIAQAYDEIRQLGAATGHAPLAAKVVSGMETSLTRILRSVPKSNRHLSVYDELDPTYYSATSSTFIGRIFKLFGFRNIADAADTTHSGYPQLNAEYIVSSNPAIIVLADTVCCGQSAKTVAARPGWSGISAVKNGRVVAVNDDVASRWGPRIVDFARAVAAVARKQ
ncbi:MAG: ABC transporter substrate-binding protein [Acidobacteriota bacterium]|nr:ABC transporter substrate-binding protein [Acidobacteriota bacterium]